jgi:hypothetical protein
MVIEVSDLVMKNLVIKVSELVIEVSNLVTK